MWWILSALWCVVYYSYVLVFYTAPLVALALAVCLYYADADLTLLYKDKYGKPLNILKGDVVWITGASSGIGEHLAYECAKLGCKLVLSARREVELERVKKECLVHGPVKDDDILVLPMDVVDLEAHPELAKKVLDHFGQIDILVNNAGRSQRAFVKDTSVEVDRAMFDLNVLGQISLTKAVLPHWIQRKKGHVVVTSSVAGKIGLPFSADYTACKFSLHGYFESMRLEVAADNIDVTLVCPGPVFSNVVTDAFTGDVDKKWGVPQKATDKRMATERCARLMLVAVVNHLPEVWISLQPFLAFCYLNQYMPEISRWFQLRMGVKLANKLREGR